MLHADVRGSIVTLEWRPVRSGIVQLY
jgi:hypothetical protein